MCVCVCACVCVCVGTCVCFGVCVCERAHLPLGRLFYKRGNISDLSTSRSIS